MNANRRSRAGLSSVEAKGGARRSSILKKPEVTPDKENGANGRVFAPPSSSRRKSGAGDKKRRVSFSHTDQIHTISPARQTTEKRSALASRKEPEPVLQLRRKTRFFCFFVFLFFFSKKFKFCAFGTQLYHLLRVQMYWMIDCSTRQVFLLLLF